MLTAVVVVAALAGAVLLVLYQRRRTRLVSGSVNSRTDTPHARLERIRRAGL